MPEEKEKDDGQGEGKKTPSLAEQVADLRKKYRKAMAEKRALKNALSETDPIAYDDDDDDYLKGVSPVYDLLSKANELMRGRQQEERRKKDEKDEKEVKDFIESLKKGQTYI